MELAGFTHYILYLGQKEMLEWRRKGNWRVQRRDAHDGSMGIFERVFIDDGGQLARQAACLGVFMQEDDLVGLLYRLNDGFSIERHQRAQVEDLDINSLFRQQFGGLLRGVDHGRISNDAQVASFAVQPRFAQRDGVVALGNVFFDSAIEKLVFQDEHRIVI